MLIRITNRCTMGCSHCMIAASSPNGEHMSMETFDKALDLCDRLGVAAVMLSGGEPFEHQSVLEMADRCIKRHMFTMITSNGLFVLDPEMRQRAIDAGVLIQITNDPRYYPRNLDLVRAFCDRPYWTFEDRIRLIAPCRRSKENGIAPTRKSPMCFNLRSVTRARGIEFTIPFLQSAGKICSPSINADGSLVAGEMDTCFKIGDVMSSNDEITQAIRDMRCNKCGLQENLHPLHLDAIGVR